MGDIVRKLFPSISPAIFIVSNIFLFTPFTIYNGNIDEFSVSFPCILTFLALPALVTLFILSIIALSLPKNMHRRYISIEFIFGMLIFIQGNIVVWNYGLLDGQSINWSEDVWRALVDGTLWVMLIVTSVLFYKHIYKIAVTASIVLFFLQLTLVISTGFQNQEIWKDNERFSLPISPPQGIYEFSSEQNVIHIILDNFQSTLFQEIIDEDPDYYSSALDGFTFFKETTGSFPTTYMSIPAILSGVNYKNDSPMAEFKDRILNGKTIVNTLYDKGYEMDYVINSSLFLKGLYSNAYIIPNPYGITKPQAEQSNAILMLDLVLFRHAPHYLKRIIYNNQLWYLQSLFSKLPYEGKWYFSHSAFLDDLIENMLVNRSKPVYKFVHLMTTHPPIVVNENCEYAGKVIPATRENFKRQLKCSLKHIVAFLKKLKLLGIYHSSLIILNADHGAKQKVEVRNMDEHTADPFFPYEVGSALPLMAIKLPYSEGALKISRAQTSLTDIPATISSILNIDENFNGKNVFEIDSDEVRERKYYKYAWTNKDWGSMFFDRIEEYIVTGSVFDRASWRLGSTYFPPGLQSFKTEKIDFGTNQASRFKHFGWSIDEENKEEGSRYNWALGKLASLYLSLPKKEAVLLTAKVKTLPFKKPQHMTLNVDGKKIVSWELSPVSWNWGKPWTWEELRIVIEPDEQRKDVSYLEFIFSEYRKPEDEYDRKRLLAILFESITLGELECDK